MSVVLVPVGTEVGEAVKEAVGARLVTLTLTVVVAVAPRLSVTRRPTARSPEVEKERVLEAVVPALTS